MADSDVSSHLYCAISDDVHNVMRQHFEHASPAIFRQPEPSVNLLPPKFVKDVAIYKDKFHRKLTPLSQYVIFKTLFLLGLCQVVSVNAWNTSSSGIAETVLQGLWG